MWRHTAYGVYLLSHLVQADPALWPGVEERIEALLPGALGVVHETVAASEQMPFGVEREEFVDYAAGQDQRRIALIERARSGGPLDLGDEEE